MKIVITRKKLPVAVVVGSITFIVTLLLFGLEGTLFCSPQLALHEKVTEPPACFSRSRTSPNSKISNEELAPINETKTASYDFKEYPLAALHESNITRKYPLALHEYNVTRTLSITFEGFEHSQNSKEEDTTRVPITQIVTTVSKRDDLLSNVSFANLLNVKESNDFQTTDFQNWTLTHMLLHYRYSFDMPHLVERGDRVCDNDTEMIIIMPAVPAHDIRRDLIRQTWASFIYGIRFTQVRPSSLRIKLAFIFGTRGLSSSRKDDLRQEALHYNDVVAADFVDSYANLSLKMMVALDWASKFCRNAKYVLKADLDTFVNIPLLSKFLIEMSKKYPRFILGYRHSSAKPPVMRTGKWQVKESAYPFSSFPPYLFGHSYVITSALLPLIVSTGKHLPLIPTEDAFITGIVAYIIRAPRLHYQGFAHQSQKVNSCTIVYNYAITLTKMSTRRFLSIWRDLVTDVCSYTELTL